MPKCKINFSFLTIKSSRVILGLFQLCPQMHIPQQKNLRPQFVEQYLRKRYNETKPLKCQKWSNMVVCLVFAICISYFCTKSTSYIACIEVLACVWFWREKKTLCHQEGQWTWKYWDKSVESADRAKKRCWLWYLVEYIVGKAEKIFLPLGPTGFGLEEISNEKGEAGAQIYHMYTKHSGQVTLIRRPISSQ